MSRYDRLARELFPHSKPPAPPAKALYKVCATERGGDTCDCGATYHRRRVGALLRREVEAQHRRTAMWASKEANQFHRPSCPALTTENEGHCQCETRRLIVRLRDAPPPEPEDG